MAEDEVGYAGSGRIWEVVASRSLPWSPGLNAGVGLYELPDFDDEYAFWHVALTRPMGRFAADVGDHGLRLGVGMPPAYRQVEFTLAAGATLLLYTDGLIERRGARLRDRQDELARVASAQPLDAEGLCLRLVEQMLPEDGPDDDVAMLAIHNVGLAAGPLEVVVPGAFRTCSAPSAAGCAPGSASAAWPTAISPAITLAALEACANAIEHAYGPDEATFDLRADRSEETIELEIRDSGRWREPRGTTAGEAWS